MPMTFQRRSFIAGLAALACPVPAALQAAISAAPDLSGLPADKRAEAEAVYARMMAALPYEQTTVKGGMAFAEWKRLKGLGKGWPVIVGDDEALDRLAEQYSIDDPTVSPSPQLKLPPIRSTSAILKAADHLTYPKDLNSWDGAFKTKDLHAPLGTWPKDAAALPDAWGISIALDLLKGAPLETAHALFIPTAQSWEVPAFLRWGGWNACPPPEYHVAALRHWHEAFGAQLVAISGDRMDLHVERPPASHAQALAVAREIYRYCPDIVDQGTETVAALAATMVSGHWWNFWWD